MQVVATLAPAPPVELGEHTHQHLGAVGPGGPVLVPADRQLPADVGLVLQRMYAVAQGLCMQGAAAATGKVGVIEEDARAVRPEGGAPGGRLTVHRVHLGVVLEAPSMVLP